MLRSALRLLVRFLFSILAHIESAGLENIPETGAAILAPNHVSRLDSPLIFIMLKRHDASGLVADKYQKHLLMRWLVKIIDGIWINRESSDFQALRQARTALEKGWLLGVAPEGTRSPTGMLMPGKTGVAFLAEKTGVPIVPIAITGTETFFHKLSHLRRPQLTIQFGKPLKLGSIKRNDRSIALQRNTDEIMCHIAAMLPLSYRGVYSEHPRLLDLLHEQSLP
jgi:1-acyl-sn-glycerol-3-phosphate acyltransferase